SCRVTSARNCNEIGPSFTCTVACHASSPRTCVSSAPGTQGTTRGTSLRRAQAAAGEAGTSKLSSRRTIMHGTLTRVAPFSIRELIERNRGRELELHARTINPQFVRVLETIGFDRHWARGEGAYLYDSDGNLFLDMLGGFGMYNVGRSNPRIRAALQEGLELELPGRVALGVTHPAGLLAEELL